VPRADAPSQKSWSPPLPPGVAERATGVAALAPLSGEMVRTTEPERSIVERREMVRMLAAPARGHD
jgi:hypothetical protein